MSRRGAAGLALLALLATAALLAGCGRGDPDAPPQLDEYYLGRRRKDVPFGPSREPLAAGTLSEAQRMDRVERLIEGQRYAEATAELDAWIAGGGDHPRAHYLRGRIAFGEQRWADACASLERAVQASPRYVEPRLLLAQAFLKQERLAAAEGVYQELDRLGPKMPWGPLGMGLVAQRRGDTARATALLDEALARDPQHAPSLRARADLARGANDDALEERLLLRYVAEEPDSAASERRLGELAAAARRYDDARRRFERSWELERDASVARRLAEIAQLRGDQVEAQRWQQRAGVTAPAPASDAAKPDQAR